jgi:ATP-dependent protease ClpP protease subunit
LQHQLNKKEKLVENELDFMGIIGWDIMPDQFSRDLKAFNGEDVILNVGSGGGYISDGISIMNTINAYPGRVTARISFAASMATQVAMVCDNVEVYENAVFMIHEASGGSYGRARDMVAKGNLLNSYNKMLARNYVKKTGKSEDEIANLMDAETYMFGQEIVDEGFADTIIAAKVDSETDSNILKDLAMNMVKDCEAKLNEKPETVEKLAACMDSIKPKLKEEIIVIDENIKKDDIIVTVIKKEEGDLNMDEEIQAALTADRERCTAIMSLGCSAEMATKAINEGKSAGDVALEIILADKKVKEINLKNFEESGKELNLDLDIPNASNKSAEQLAIEAADEAFYSERKGK